MRIFEREYVFLERLRIAGGKTETVVIRAVGWENLAHESFMAGYKWAREHPGLVPKGSQ